MSTFELKKRQETNYLFQVAFKYFAVKLGLSQDELRLISARVVLGRKLGDNIDANAHGICSAHYIKNELTRVNILIKDQSDLGLIDTLAHEMVHAKQNIRGEFTFEKREKITSYFFNLIKVKREYEVRVHAGQVVDETFYWDLKCEQEAFEASRELVRQFLNFFATIEQNAVAINDVYRLIETDPNNI